MLRHGVVLNACNQYVLLLKGVLLHMWNRCLNWSNQCAQQLALRRWLTRAAECTWRICKVSHAYHKEGHVKGTLWSPVSSEFEILHSLWGRPHRRMAGTAAQTRHIRSLGSCEVSIKLWKGHRPGKMTLFDGGWFSGWTPRTSNRVFPNFLDVNCDARRHWSPVMDNSCSAHLGDQSTCIGDANNSRILGWIYRWAAVQLRLMFQHSTTQMIDQGGRVYMTDLQGQSCLSQGRSCKGDLVKPRLFRIRDFAQFMRSTAPTYCRNGCTNKKKWGMLREASVKLWKGRRQFKMTFSDDGWFSGWTPPYLVHSFYFGLGSKALQQYHWSFFHAFII